MNVFTGTGYLTSDPTVRKVKVGETEVTVANFTVAVRDTFGEKAEAEFIHVSAWRGLGDTCAKFLKKGRRVDFRGPVHLNTYINKYGQPGAYIEVRAEKIEFASANAETATPTVVEQADPETGELPFEE